MKSFQSFLTVVTVAFLTIVSGYSDAQANAPILTIGGKADPSVYLQSLDIQVEVTGNIASTRYTMVFKNRSHRILEGELTFPLPDGRTATHYALDINGKMREAVPVEKARATQVFEEIQQREVDPGILERVEGNNFRTRIYPFPQNGTRTISIGYEEELTLENGLLYYRLPMAYPKLEKFSVKATVWQSNLEPIVPKSEEEIRFDKAGENYVAAFTRENYQPSSSLIFALPAPADIPQVMMQSAQGSFYFLASVAPKLETRKKYWRTDMAIIWDVSLSGSQRDLKREMGMLDDIFSQKKNANVHLYFLNNRLKKTGTYKVANGDWSKLKKDLEAAVFDGGTDFSQINLNNISGNEILFFSDGISTLSDIDFLSKNNTKRPKRPIHCIVSSPKADYSAMRLIAGKTKGKFMNLNALSAEKLKDELLNETLQFLGTEHKNTVREVYPSIATPVFGNFSVAGISETNDAEVTLLFGFGDKVERRIKVKLDAQKATSQGNIYKIWAQKKIAELDLDYEKNRDILTELGQQFGIVTRNTSLMVLELISDYVRFGIEPPDSEPELQAAYRRLVEERDKRQSRHGTQCNCFECSSSRNMLNDAVTAAGNIAKWLGIDYTPKKLKYPVPDGKTPNQHSTESSRATKDSISSTVRGHSITNERRETVRVEETSDRKEEPKPVRKEEPPQKKVESKPAKREEPSKDKRESRAFAFESAEVIGYLDNPTPVFIMDMNDPDADLITLDRSFSDNIRYLFTHPSEEGAKKLYFDRPYFRALTGKVADDYQMYLDIRKNYANSPAFYFDMAGWFYKHNDKEIALRILTSIAELELEDAMLYRMLAYRLKEYGEYALQKFVTKKVLEWRPMEPQSYRDYALALADNGETQAALDSLYSLLTRPFSTNIARRNRIEEVVVTEINHLLAKHPNLSSSKIDERVLLDIPVDARVVLNWNMDNVRIGLYLRGPDGKDYTPNTRKSIGVAGYGPEQIMLKDAIKGRYTVYAEYHSAREFAAPGPVTVMLEIYTKYADKTEQRRVVTQQLSRGWERGRGRTVIATEFELDVP